MVKPMYSTLTSILRRDGLQNVLQVGEREARVDDIFDDDDVAAFDAAIQVFDYLYLAGRLGARPVARHRHEIERRRRRQLPRQIREEDERPLQHTHQMNAVRMIAMNVHCHRLHTFVNVGRWDEDVHREVN